MFVLFVSENYVPVKAHAKTPAGPAEPLLLV
jgi:hypothetical protein